MKSVMFTGCSKEQAMWANCTGVVTDLKIGEVYQVDHTEVYSWHTKLYLKGIVGSCNSVCFNVVE